MTLKKLALLTLACAMTFSCDTTSKSSGGDSRGKESGKPSASCIPEAKLLAANIIQGTEVRPADEDSKAVMMVFSNGELCTGSAISENVILTAAHCVVKGDTTNTTVIFYPSLSCESGFNRATYSIPVSKIVVHSAYDSKLEADQTKGDIAVVVLASKIPDGYPIYPIAKPEEENEDVLILYGYGKTGSNQKGAGILRRTIVDTFVKETVNAKIKITQENGPGICQGDSGGPSLIYVGGQLKILGINSYVSGDSKDVCNRNSFQVLAWSYKLWIDEQIAAAVFPTR